MLDGAVFAIEEDQREAVGIGDAFEGTPEDGFFFFGDDLIERGWVRCAGIGGAIEGVGGVDGLVDLAANGIAGEIVSDAAEP